MILKDLVSMLFNIVSRESYQNNEKINRKNGDRVKPV